jgi:hypothetical protein
MSKGLDSTASLASKAALLAANGYTFAARYIFERSDFKTPLTKQEANELSKAGLSIVTIFESGSPTSAAYFNGGKGESDGIIARAKARDAGQPAGTPIYAAVDYDAAPDDLDAIAAYFASFREQIKQWGYVAGVYGSGLVCDRLAEIGLVSYTWLSQSKGFAGYDHWLPRANLVQGRETELHAADVDLDASEGAGGGWKVAG